MHPFATKSKILLNVNFMKRKNIGTHRNKIINAVIQSIILTILKTI